MYNLNQLGYSRLDFEVGGPKFTVPLLPVEQHNRFKFNLGTNLRRCNTLAILYCFG
jgi:hypothetical protein